MTQCARSSGEGRESGLSIRLAAASDLDAICELHAKAFTASTLGYHGEAELVRALVEEGDALVSLGAWYGQALAGHILFSRMDVVADGAPLSAAALAPVAVLPAHRREGAASALIAEGHRLLAQQGTSIAFVLGDPAYYGRFGYRFDLAALFTSPYSGPAFLACALDSAAPRPQRGHAIHAAAFSRLA